MSAAMFAPAERPVAELTLVLLLGGARRLGGRGRGRGGASRGRHGFVDGIPIRLCAPAEGRLLGDTGRLVRAWRPRMLSSCHGCRARGEVSQKCGLVEKVGGEGERYSAARLGGRSFLLGRTEGDRAAILDGERATNGTWSQCWMMAWNLVVCEDFGMWTSSEGILEFADEQVREVRR